MPNELCYEQSSRSHLDPIWSNTQPEHVIDPKQLWDNVVIRAVRAESYGAQAIGGTPSISFQRTLRSPAHRAVEYSVTELRSRLDHANQHFRRKAAAVLRDKDAALLLATLYKQSNMRVQDFDTCTFGIPLAKLAAANFCDIGSRSIYITMAGREFIESIAES